MNGVFAGSPVWAASRNAARPTLFVMPGTRLAIFPVGLVITVAWALLGIAVMTLGYHWTISVPSAIPTTEDA